MLNADRFCAHLIRLIHAPIRVYDAQGRLLKTYMDNGEQEDPVVCDGELLRDLLEQRRPDFPLVHLDGEDVVYGILCGEDGTYIVGPCCLLRDTDTAARRLVRQHGMDRKRPYRLTHFPLTNFEEALLALHECLTGTVMDLAELHMKNVLDNQFERELREKVHREFFTRREESAVHNPYSQEIIEQWSIRSGDLEGLYRSFQIAYMGKIGTLAREPLRQARNLAIINITLACRSAIWGGLPPEVSYTMADAFTQRVEETRTEAEAYALMRAAEVEFCKAVRDLAQSGAHSAAVRRCKELISQRLHSKLTVKDLAAEVGLTPDYLSHLFLKEEKVKLTDYILREKINAAKNQLIYSDSSYEAVALSLGFASQSHFGQVFKRLAGLTPRRYREKYRPDTSQTAQKSSE